MSVQILKLKNGTFLIGDRQFSAERAISNHAPAKFKNVLQVRNNSEITEKMTALSLIAYMPFAEDGIVQIFEDQIEAYSEANKHMQQQYEASVKHRFA
jgi:hypothetical protein